MGYRAHAQSGEASESVPQVQTYIAKKNILIFTAFLQIHFMNFLYFLRTVLIDKGTQSVKI